MDSLGGDHKRLGIGCGMGVVLRNKNNCTLNGYPMLFLKICSPSLNHSILITHAQYILHKTLFLVVRSQ